MPNSSRRFPPGAFNFVWLPGKTYIGVQEQIFGLLEAQLPPGSVVHTVDDAVDGAVSLSLFIRQGRGDKAKRVPADIVMAHGIADKRYFFIQDSDSGAPLINEYPFVFIPGNWHVNRIVESRYRRNPGWQVTMLDEQIVKVGWLRLDPLLQLAAAPDKQRHHKLRVLWAPTHNMTKGASDEIVPSSYPAFAAHENDVAPNFEYQVSLHPRNRANKRPTSNQLVWTDVLVSDFGTMVYEAWALGKPVIFPRWCIDVDTILTRNPRSAEAYIYRNRIGLHADSMEEMQRMLTDIQEHVVGNRWARLRKRITRTTGVGNRSADLRGPGVAQFIDHYVDPEMRGNDSLRTAQALMDIAATRGLEIL
jgi:hypothetical protein